MVWFGCGSGEGEITRRINRKEKYSCLINRKIAHGDCLDVLKDLN